MYNRFAELRYFREAIRQVHSIEVLTVYEDMISEDLRKDPRVEKMFNDQLDVIIKHNDKYNIKL